MIVQRTAKFLADIYHKDYSIEIHLCEDNNSKFDREPLDDRNDLRLEFTHVCHIGARHWSQL